MYYNHYIIIKYIGFKPIHCTINLDATPSFKVFSEFDYVFLLNIFIV